MWECQQQLRTDGSPVQGKQDKVETEAPRQRQWTEAGGDSVRAHINVAVAVAASCPAEAQLVHSIVVAFTGSSSTSTPLMHQPAPAGLSGLCRLTDHLYLSNGRAAGDASQVTRNKITCIINVTETRSSSSPPPPPPPPGVEEYIHIPVTDSPVSPLCDHFDDVADKIQLVAERGGRTLVHCNAGVSRSAALCMAYLLKHRGVSLLEAHRWVKTCRPMVRPNNGFWRQLIQYERERRGCTSVRMVSSSMGEIPDIYEEEARNMTPL